MAFHVQPLGSQPNLLARKKDTEREEPPLVKLTTFGSQGSTKEVVETTGLLAVAKPATEWDRVRSLSFGNPEQKSESRAEEGKRRDDTSFPVAKVVEPYESQPTAGFAADTHIRDRMRMAEDSHESESIFTLVTDQSEAELMEKAGEERTSAPAEDSVHMRKTAILRLQTGDREEFELIHRCCRRLQKGVFAVVSVYRDEDWWLVSVSELISRSRCEVVLEPGHAWTQKHSALDLASLIEKDPEGRLILPAQRIDLFVPKESDQNLSVQTNSSDRRKSASFGPKRDTVRKKVFSGVEYEVGIEFKTHGAKAELSVSATPQPGHGLVMMECFTQTDLREASISIDTSDIEKVADALLPKLQVAQGELRLRPTMTRRESIASLIPEISGISYQTSRVLNNNREYIISFSSIILGTGTEKTIYVDAQPQDDGLILQKQLEIDEEELRQLVDFPDGEFLPEHLEAFADLLIIENGNELHLGKRQANGKRSCDAPAIVVVMDRSERDDYAPVPAQRQNFLTQKSFSCDSAHTAAVRIQAYWRMHLAIENRELRLRAKSRTLVLRCGVLSPFCILSAHETSTVTSESLSSDSTETKPLKQTQRVTRAMLLALFVDETSQKETLAIELQKLYRGNAAREQVNKAKAKSQHVPIQTKVQTHDNSQFIVSAYKKPSVWLIEATPSRPEFRGQMLKATITEKEMRKRELQTDVNTLMQSIVIKDGKITLKAACTVVHRCDLKLDGSEFQIIVSVENAEQWRSSVMTFLAQREREKLEVSCAVSELLESVGDVPSVVILADISVTTLLRLNEGELWLDTSKHVEEMTVRLQAASRGFLERKRLKRRRTTKGKLVAATSKVMAGQKHAVYAYANEAGIIVQAQQKGREPLTLEVKKIDFEKLGPKQYCEQSVFPKLGISPEGKLELLESDRPRRRAHLSVQSLATTSITSLPPSPTGADTSSPVHSKTLKRFDSENVSETDEPSFHMKIPTPKVKPERRLKRAVVKKRNKSETAQGLTQRKSKCTDVLFIPVYEGGKSELITKVGADISGSYFVVAVYRVAKGVRIEATQAASNLVLKLLVQEEVPIDQQDAEMHCAALIDRLRLRKSKDGVSLELRAAAPQVLYKRSHYISERYMVVTVFDLGQSVELQAADPASQKTLKLTLGRMKFLTQELLYRELCMLVKRLRVEKVLGEEVLILSQ